MDHNPPYVAVSSGIRGNHIRGGRLDCTANVQPEVKLQIPNGAYLTSRVAWYIHMGCSQVLGGHTASIGPSLHGRTRPNYSVHGLHDRLLLLPQILSSLLLGIQTH